MNLLVHLFGTLCGVGSATLATAATRRRAVMPAVVGFGLVAAWTGLDRVPNPPAVGFAVAVVSVLLLLKPGLFPLAAAAAGALAGCWVPVLRAQAVGFAPALLLATGVPLISMLLASRRPTFAPLSIYQETLFLVTVLGLGVAGAPAIADGWRSAGVMNLEYEAAQVMNVEAWVLAIGAGTLMLGGGYSLWWRGR